jgi:hypothetical protein
MDRPQRSTAWLSRQLVALGQLQTLAAMPQSFSSSSGGDRLAQDRAAEQVDRRLFAPSCRYMP